MNSPGADGEDAEGMAGTDDREFIFDEGAPETFYNNQSDVFAFGVRDRVCPTIR